MSTLVSNYHQQNNTQGYPRHQMKRGFFNGQQSVKSFGIIQRKIEQPIHNKEQRKDKYQNKFNQSSNYYNKTKEQSKGNEKKETPFIRSIIPQSNYIHQKQREQQFETNDYYNSLKNQKGSIEENKIETEIQIVVNGRDIETNQFVDLNSPKSEFYTLDLVFGEPVSCNDLFAPSFIL